MNPFPHQKDSPSPPNEKDPSPFFFVCVCVLIRGHFGPLLLSSLVLLFTSVMSIQKVCSSIVFQAKDFKGKCGLLLFFFGKKMAFAPEGRGSPQKTGIEVGRDCLLI